MKRAPSVLDFSVDLFHLSLTDQKCTSHLQKHDDLKLRDPKTPTTRGHRFESRAPDKVVSVVADWSGESDQRFTSDWSGESDQRFTFLCSKNLSKYSEL